MPRIAKRAALYEVQRVVIDGLGAEADVIVVRAYRDVLAAQLRVGAADDRDDVARRRRIVREPDVSLDGLARLSLRCRVDRRAEQCFGAPRASW